MHFKLTQEMKQRIIVYSTSFIIAILFFTILNKFKDIKRAIQFILTILFPFLLGIELLGTCLVYPKNGKMSRGKPEFFVKFEKNSIYRHFLFALFLKIVYDETTYTLRR